MPNLIQLDQTGFIRQRQTQDSIRRTLHILWHIQHHKINSMFLGLDAEKAFDTVRWLYLYKVLEKFGFHSTIIKAFQGLYNKPTARIKVNGNLSQAFILERSCRQGCPCSPLLFALFLEPLSQYIKQNTNIKGIDINGEEQKLSLFADDILVYLGQPNESLEVLMETLTLFGDLSGYKLNVQKTQILTFNCQISSYLKGKCKFTWGEKCLKYLGVQIPKDITRLFDVNYKPLYSTIKSDLARWNLLPYLGLYGRVESIKMNILPQFLYLFHTLPIEISKQNFIEWDRLISRFIWQGKKTKNKI